MNLEQDYQYAPFRQKVDRAVRYILILLVGWAVLYIIDNNVTKMGSPPKWFKSIALYTYFLNFGFLTGIMLWSGLQYLQPIFGEMMGGYRYVSTVATNTVIIAFALIFISYINEIIQKSIGIVLTPTWKEYVIGYVIGRILFIVIFFFFQVISTKDKAASSSQDNFVSELGHSILNSTEESDSFSSKYH